MSDKVSLHAIDQMYQRTSDDPLLMLLSLKFPDLTEYHFVNNTENITSNGQEYTALPFSFSLPTDSDEEIPELSVTISNVGLELVDSLSSATGIVSSNIYVVFASVPDIAEISVEQMVLKRITSNPKQITLRLGFDDILNTKIPSQTYSARNYPGLLNG